MEEKKRVDINKYPRKKEKKSKRKFERKIYNDFKIQKISKVETNIKNIKKKIEIGQAIENLDVSSTTQQIDRIYKIKPKNNNLNKPESVQGSFEF